MQYGGTVCEFMATIYCTTDNVHMDDIIAALFPYYIQ